MVQIPLNSKSQLQVLVRDEPLENLWVEVAGGGGWAKYKKNIRARES